MSVEHETVQSSDGVPPVGEEIHLPGPSLVPIVNAFGLSLVLLGLMIALFLTWIVTAIFVLSLIRWINDTRRDISELPLEHH